MLSWKQLLCVLITGPSQWIMAPRQWWMCEIFSYGTQAIITLHWRIVNCGWGWSEASRTAGAKQLWFVCRIESGHRLTKPSKIVCPPIRNNPSAIQSLPWEFYKDPVNKSASPGFKNASDQPWPETESLRWLHLSHWLIWSAWSRVDWIMAPVGDKIAVWRSQGGLWWQPRCNKAM